jgi:septation ring formation regulator EzrA
MTYYVIGFLVLVAAYVVGFLMGKRHGERLTAAAITIADTIKKA